MKSVKAAVSIFIFLSLFLQSNLSIAQEPEKEKTWSGTLLGGKVIGEKDLAKILADHKRWLVTDGRQGEQADLSGAKLQKAFFRGVDLRNAVLIDTDLQEACLNNANLRNANMKYSNLEGASLMNVKFRDAYLFGAVLRNADLTNAGLENTVLTSASIDGAIFELKPNRLPNITTIAKTKSLALLRYKKLPHSLVELREEFKSYGLREQEREVTLAIKRSGYVNAMQDGDLPTRIQVLFGKYLFDFTCQWGMSPLRPLLILVIFIGLFSPLYIFSLKKILKNDGIWMFWIEGRARKDLGCNEPELLTCGWKGAIHYGIYFSVLSAFHVGWRELNVGNWIARMQLREYRLQASGWVRFISGLQSLLSVYLLALSVLVYFGRPFESY